MSGEPDRIAAIQAPEAPHVNPDYAECWQSGWRAGFQAATDRLAVVERERDRETEMRRSAEEHARGLVEAFDQHPYPDEYDDEKNRADRAEAALLTLQRQARRAEACLREWVAQDGWTNASVAYQAALSVEIAQELAALLPSLAEKEPQHEV